jgi:hypothetical protein
MPPRSEDEMKQFRQEAKKRLSKYRLEAKIPRLRDAA